MYYVGGLVQFPEMMLNETLAILHVCAGQSTADIQTLFIASVVTYKDQPLSVITMAPNRSLAL